MSLVDSTPLRGDVTRLRARFAEQGYLFFRAMLDRDLLSRAAASVRRTLTEFGWIGETADGPVILRSPAGWDDFLATYEALQSTECVHQVAYDPTLTRLVADLVGEPTFVQPGKVMRAAFPRPVRETEPHQDYLIQQGSIRAVTCWVPLADCPTERGGLAVMPGSHLGGLREPATELGRYYFEVAADDPAWAGADFVAGDVLLFHPLTVHASGVNVTDTVRMSLDFRVQPASVPIRSGLVMPHMHPRIPAWEALTRGWSSTEWVEVPLATPVEFVGRQDDFRAIQLQVLVEQARERAAAHRGTAT